MFFQVLKTILLIGSGKYGKVALEGDILEFEQYSRPLKRWYAVTAYSPQNGYLLEYSARYQA